MPTINGTSGNDTLNGTDGDDAINGLGGNDTINGGWGNDTVDAGAGDDTLQPDADNDILQGGDGDDIIYDWSGDDVIDGGAGIDTVTFVTSGINHVVNLGSTTIEFTGEGSDIFVNVENIVGSDGNDIFYGSGLANQISGGGGEDIIGGYGGDDVLTGGLGADRFDFFAGDGSDTITDLSSADSIKVWDYSSAQSVAQVGSDVVITLSDTDKITCLNTDLATVQAVLWLNPDPPPPPPPPPPSIIPPLPAPPGAPNSGQITPGGSSYSVASGSYVYMVDDSRVGELFPSGVTTLTNAGTIYLEDVPGSPAALSLVTATAFDQPTIDSFTNSGTLVVHAVYGNTGAYGIFDHSPYGDISTDVANSGQIFCVSKAGTACAVLTEKWNSSVINSGLIAVQADLGPAIGIDLVHGGTINNQAGGQILVSGSGNYGAYTIDGIFGSPAIGVLIEGSAFPDDGSNPVELTNAGLIEVQNFNNQPGWGVIAYGDVVNSGTITASIAAYVYGTLINSGTLNGDVISNLALTFNNSGTLNGDFIGGDTEGQGPPWFDTVTNSGAITGNAYLSGGDDVFANSGAGHIDGIVDLGPGADQYAGAGAVDRVTGEQGNDIIDGGGANDLLMGGSGDDQLTGGTGNDGLYGEGGRDLIQTAGGDVVDAGTGADRVELGDYSFRSVEGGDGLDTLVLASGAVILDLSAALAAGRITDFEIIEMRANQSLIVRPSDVAAIGAGISLRIDGTATDTVTLVGAWVQGSNVSVNGLTYEQWSLSGETVLVSLAANVVASASAPAGTGLDAIAAGAIPLLPGDAAGIDFQPTDWQVANYEIIGTLTIEEGQTWVGLDGDNPVYAWRDTSRLVVDGTLAAINDVHERAVAADFMNFVETTNNGLITAQSTGPMEYPLPAYFPYVIGACGVSGGFKLTNNGLIDAYSVYGTAEAVGKMEIWPADDTFPETYVDKSYVPIVINSGTIQAWSEHSFAFGLADTQQTTNTGTIQAHGARGSIAIWSEGFVHNSATGVITAETDGTGTETAILVHDQSGGVDGTAIPEVVNAGLIAARIAIDVQFAPFGFHLDNSGHIYGLVNLGGEVDTATNTGTIDGDINLGAANDTYDGHSGVQNGIIHAGDGNDSVTGGKLVDTLYGDLGHDTLIGNAGNDFLEGGYGDDVMDGGLGVDIASYDEANYFGVNVNLGITVAQNTVGAGWDTLTGIENLIGSNLDDQLTGNSTANSLYGLDGNDLLDGGAGADKLYGGLGNDTFVVDDINDIISEYSGEGTDLAQASVTYTLRSGIENLTLTGVAAIDGTGNAVANFIRGNGAANTLDGGNGNDTLYGNAGNDTLIGGSGNDLLQGNTGNDNMAGGIGNDIYYVDALGDVVTENAGEGTDVVRSSITYTLGADVEDLTLLGTAANATGNGLNNNIHGSDIANLIDGGAGSDQMYGLDGDDTYVVDDGGDRVFETVTGGADTVLASITFKLGSGVENVTLTGASSIDATGNSLANVLIGNAGSNELVGQTGNDALTGNDGNDILNGGEGADAMTGGTGNDTYYVDNAGDTVTENAGEGTDVVKASVSWALGVNIENLTQGGSASIDATGNGQNNSIHGNIGANVLNGAGGDDALNGGAGADTLIGGVGRDTMTGGADNDLFKFADGDFGGVTRSTADRIVDFATGDKVDLSAVDANTLLASDQGFSFIGTGAFSHAAGELRYEQVAGNTYLSGDTNGDGIADFMIKLDGLHTVSGADLIF